MQTLSPAHETGRSVTARDFLSAMGLFALFFALTLLCHYDADYFFYWDEWDVIGLMSVRPLRELLFLPHNEHLMPVHRVFFYLTTSLFGEQYGMYVVLNAAIHSLNNLVLFRLLHRQLGRASLALVFSGAYLLSHAQWDNLTIAFQSQVFLCAFFTLLSLWYVMASPPHSIRGVLLAGGFALLAAWSFGGGLVAAPLLAISAAVDRWIAPPTGSRKPPVWPVLWYLGLCGVIAAVYLAAAGMPVGTDSSAAGQTMQAGFLGGGLRWGASLFYSVATTAIYGPLAHLMARSPEALPLFKGFLISWVFVIVGIVATWRGPWRGLFLKSLCFLLGLFLLIGAARLKMGAAAGFAERYQTLGLIGIAIALAAVCRALQTSRYPVLRASPVVLVVCVMMATASNAAENARQRPANAVRRGLAARNDYYRLKSEMLSADGAFPEVMLTRNGHPGLPAGRLAEVIAFLDPGARCRLPTRFRPVRYVEQRENSVPWGEIRDGRGPVQTVRFAAAGRVEQVELLFGTGDKRGVADCLIALLDDRNGVLCEERLAGRTILNNCWISCRMHGAVVAAGRDYRIRVRGLARDSSSSCTIWMNTNPNAYPDGETVAPDGTQGDLCFAVAVSSN